MRSKKQQIASQRNWNKMRILGIITNLKTIRDSHLFNTTEKVTDRWEETCINEAIGDLEEIIDRWNACTEKLIENS